MFFLLLRVWFKIFCILLALNLLSEIVRALLLCAICAIIHIVGFSYTPEPLPHELFFCGTFFGFALIAIFGNLGICLRVKIPLGVEVATSATGFVCYGISAVVSMYHAEHDDHLQYLTDNEEWSHFFYAICRLQSIACLFTAMVYLLHTILMIDLLSITRQPTNIHTGRRVSLNDRDEEAMQPLRLNFFCQSCVDCVTARFCSSNCCCTLNMDPSNDALP